VRYRLSARGRTSHPRQGRGRRCLATGETMTVTDALPPPELEDRVLPSHSDLAGLGALFRFSRGVHLRLAASLALIVASAAAVMVSARVLGGLVEAVADPSGRRAIWQLGAIFLALEAAAIAGQYLGRVSLARATIEITYRI